MCLLCGWFLVVVLYYYIILLRVCIVPGMSICGVCVLIVCGVSLLVGGTAGILDEDCSMC